jgi:hypothetical protein
MNNRMHPPTVLPAENPNPSATKPRARLTEDQVIRIFKLKLDSPRPSSAKLAPLYGVSEKAVRDIWTGRTWSRETRHLDISRPLQLKPSGRPNGCRDKQPRKKRVGGMQNREASPSLLTCPSCESVRLRGPSPVRIARTELAWEAFNQRRHAPDDNNLLCCPLTLHGCGAILTDRDEDTEVLSHGLSPWHPSDPSLSSPSMRLHASVDDQLHEWDAFWRSSPSADPFGSDWAPQPFEYA